MLDLNGDQFMDLLYQPSPEAHYQGLTVALGTLDPDIYTFDYFFEDFTVQTLADLCEQPNTKD